MRIRSANNFSSKRHHFSTTRQSLASHQSLGDAEKSEWRWGLRYSHNGSPNEARVGLLRLPVSQRRALTWLLVVVLDTAALSLLHVSKTSHDGKGPSYS